MQDMVNSVHISNHQSFHRDHNILYDIGRQTNKAFIFNKNTHAKDKYVQK